VHNTGVDEVPLRSRKINDRVLCGYAALFAEGLWLSEFHEALPPDHQFC
jgi:hypothetical protein